MRWGVNERIFKFLQLEKFGLIFSSSAFVIHVNPQPSLLLYSLVFFFPGTFRFPSI